MFKYEEKTIYVTRGDVGSFEVTADFKAGDIVRFKVTAKKDCEKVVCQRDFEVSEDTSSIEIALDDEATRLGDVISKPTDYWYEVELNPDTNPQTIIGYDEDGAKILRLFPEGADVNGEDIEVVGKKTLQELVEYALYEAKESGEFDGPQGIQGEPGHTPERGVDYWTEADKEEITSEVLFQVKPEFANSIEECTDTTKMYVLPDGYLYAYMMTETEGGLPAFTNCASPTSDDWQYGYRYRDDGVLATATSANSFVSNFIPCKQGDIIRIKGVKDAMPIDTEIGAHTWMKVKPYDAGGNELGPSKAAYYLTQPYSRALGKSLAQAVSKSDDDVYSYEIFWVSATESTVKQAEFSADVAQIRVSGVYAGSASDVIITVNEEIVYTEPTIGYQWANTGHAFVSSDYEDRIVALEQESDAASAEISDLHERVNYSVGEIYGLKIAITDLQNQVKSGARWFALGDSITQGYASIANGDGTPGYIITDPVNRWVNIVAQMNGYELTNYGIGGTGYLQGEKNARVLVDTIDFSECDFVTLAYGVNDWKNAVNIGSMDDDIASGGSMVANMRYVIKKILADNPYCKIFVITPINCRSLGNYTTNWGINYKGAAANSLGLEDIFQRQKEVCEYHGIELIDMTHSSIINRENIKTILADYVHPTVEGHKMMARELASKIHFK